MSARLFAAVLGRSNFGRQHSFACRNHRIRIAAHNEGSAITQVQIGKLVHRNHDLSLASLTKRILLRKYQGSFNALKFGENKPLPG